MLQRVFSNSNKKFDTKNDRFKLDRRFHISTIEAIFAILWAAKATSMLFWSLCYHGQMPYMAKNGREAGQHSHKVTDTFGPQIL